MLIFFCSFQSLTSLLAAIETDPEDMLKCLGFDDSSSVSSLQRVPARFFNNSSQAKGINPQKIYHDVLDMDDEVSGLCYCQFICS